jgi:hypothetical protein
MNLFGEQRRSPRYSAGIRAEIRAVLLRPGWHAHIASGGAVITDVGAGGIKILHDFPHKPGTVLKIEIPSERIGEAELEVTATVVWSRRNENPAFGRNAVGLAFSPEIQPDATTLAARFRDHDVKASPVMA